MKWGNYFFMFLAAILICVFIVFVYRWQEHTKYCYQRGMEPLKLTYVWFCVDKEGRVYR